MKRQWHFAFWGIFIIFVYEAGLCGAQTWSALASEQLVQAGNPSLDILLAGYTVPSYVDWNNDGKNDLIVGAKQVEIVEGDLVESGKVYVYLNEGQNNAPVFGDYFFAQSDSNDLTCPVSGCMSCFPRVVYWDADDRKDLLMGQSDGTIKIFLNVNTDQAPAFDGGSVLQAGPACSKQAIYVGGRATPTVVDWNNDAKKDLVIGAYDGKIHLFLNEGTDTDPNFMTETFAQEDGDDLVVPGQRSSPHVCDIDGDGKKDILAGDTEGQLLLYLNVGTDEAPAFSGYTLVEANGAAIDLPSSNPTEMVRSRPFVCDWSGDHYLDVLIGAGTGQIHLFEGLVFAGDLEPDGDVDLTDFAAFTVWWLDADCASKNDCGGADIFGDGQVSTDDFAVLAQNWLAGK